MGVRKSMQERLAKYKIIPETQCWEWYGGCDNQGYGRCGPEVATRASYKFHKGPIPPGMLVCHVCDNPPCINPDHLFLGTHTDNARDKINKGRGFTGLGRQGREYGSHRDNAKLTDEDVTWMRANRDKYSNKYFAELFNMSNGRICDILNRKAWTHVQ